MTETIKCSFGLGKSAAEPVKKESIKKRGTPPKAKAPAKKQVEVKRV